MRHRKYKYFACVSILIYCYYYLGVSDYLYSKSFKDNFDYPLNVDIKPLVADVLSGRTPSVAPINYYPYRFLSNSGKCATLHKIDLFIAVKSAMNHFGHRNAIRRTYAQNKVRGRNVQTLFFLGIDRRGKSDTQRAIEKEMAEFKDIIQMDFHDDYFNNTIKTVMTFRWLYEHCSKADFYLFTDDDMYISVKNLLNYVDELKYSVKDRNDTDFEMTYTDNDVTVATEDSNLIFAGYVFKSAPQRFRSSKWRVSLEEYPWNRWPPYVTAGAYVVSNSAMKTMYVASLFVKHFRFDDIYLGIVAKKVGIKPTHCPMFHFYKKKYSKDAYSDVIASHGYSDHEELITVWNEQNNS
ncbi:beta-1,3-galactosyltransferase brn isoform X1 [Manduca sexta]|uniref:Hexosyltransferase n=1 Tax=Manduca sexta TaxID=7130 RepID=A0A921YN24_MANSE|nr:beta-1,3-galactosyltransferase brn isoform X1 [Manduca sexta]KAG6442328.1 hypothetical protein O3G_MSEX002333 [Manduca sexta]